VTLFRLDASIFPDQSVSRELADIVEAEWTAAHPDEQVIRRHVGTSPLPSTAWADAVVGQQVPQDARTPAQQAAVELATTLADELIAADTSCSRCRSTTTASRSTSRPGSTSCIRTPA